MKIILLITLLLNGFLVCAQKEGQSFCDGDNNGQYFPLNTSTKYIVWGNTYYIEKNVGTKIFNDKTYLEYSQSWESGDVATLYLREENGVVLEYKEDKNEEQIRLPKTIETGKSWMLDRESVKYQILKTNGTLKTPVCKYKNLLVLKSTFQNGTFTFYYQKGYGYIGATQDNELISFAIPRLPKELMDKKKNKD